MLLGLRAWKDAAACVRVSIPRLASPFAGAGSPVFTGAARAAAAGVHACTSIVDICVSRRRVAYNRTCDLRFQYANTAKYPHGKSHLLFSRSFRQKRLSRRVHMSTINHVYKFVAYQVCCTFAPILQIGLRDAWLCACMCRMPSTTRRSRRINPCSQQY
ncbi:hypothetical protein SEVIR_7G194550v4 [Setaria viridis]